MLLGNTDAAADMARVLLQDPKANTETIVSAAYVEAATALPADEKTMLDTFDRALSRLAAKDSERAHTKATIALLRGKLLERVGNTSAAEKEYGHAAECDPYNAHMKECHLRLLFAHARRSRRLGQDAAARIQARDALQVAKALLKISPANEVAREAQADLFDEFGLQ